MIDMQSLREKWSEFYDRPLAKLMDKHSPDHPDRRILDDVLEVIIRCAAFSQADSGQDDPGEIPNQIRAMEPTWLRFRREFQQRIEHDKDATRILGLVNDGVIATLHQCLADVFATVAEAKGAQLPF